MNTGCGDIMFAMNNTKAIFLTVTTLCFIFGMIFFNKTIFAASFTFTRNLQLGSVGEDVRELQKILNSDISSRIRETGPGSPGQETTYFGTLTRAAVIRFQEKYKNDILTPNGLFAGTGFVGKSTMGVLNKLDGVTSGSNAMTVSDVIKSTMSNNQSADTFPSTNPPQQPSASLSNLSPNNPNTKNINLVLDAIDRIGQKKGISADKLSLAKQVVIAEAATSTDLKQQFLDVLKTTVAKNEKKPKGVWSSLIRQANNILFPKRAMAISGTPFGGALLFSMYCSESENYWITVQPLPPTFATLLTYELGTQIYLSENIPYTTELLGFYTAGAPCIQGECPYCVEMPDEGMISPEVGSNPL